MNHDCVVTRAERLCRFGGSLLLILTAAVTQTGESVSDEPVRTDLFISGVYPHLTTYAVYSQDGGHYRQGHNEAGIGAVVPWAGQLRMINYAPHMPRGSEHKLYSVAPDLRQPLTIHPESVGGTPAGRMIHEESQQLFIGHHVIDREGRIRTIPPQEMPIRVTAIARHLSDPENKVFYADMEGSIWEVDVHSLEPQRLFRKPVPGWHGKGGYTSQGRLVISNNGELHVGDYSSVLVGGSARDEEERGVLAEYDGTEWRIVERRQFTEVTGPRGITGGSDGDDPLWAVGWDRRSLRLKLLDRGEWHTYLLPKASWCNDADHGWYTEWPRIRQITDGRMMMDMHGMFFDFPEGFCQAKTGGIRPIGSHLRYVPDFCAWNGRLVLATDETSIQGNPLAGQPQSNLWFGTYEDLKTWGPASGFGGPWIDDSVTAETWSDPFLSAGFQHRVLHLANGRIRNTPADLGLRAADQQPVSELPERLTKLPRVAVNRGDWHQPAPGFQFVVNQPVTVFLAVDVRGNPELSDHWELTDMTVVWGQNHRDVVYRCEFPSGRIVIPGNQTEHTSGSFGMPHTAFVEARDTESGLTVTVNDPASLSIPDPSGRDAGDDTSAVTFRFQVDVDGSGNWMETAELPEIRLPANSYRSVILPDGTDAEWLRISTDVDCVATAFLHQTNSAPAGRESADPQLFAGLAEADDRAPIRALVYAAKRNRNLRVIAEGSRHFDFTKAGFEFQPTDRDEELEKLLAVRPECSVDNASVVLRSEGRVYRLPKGDPLFDEPTVNGDYRMLREVESERLLANIHGTFYEVPLVTNGAPPAWNRIRPVSSHRKAISDYCSWNGLLVLAGVRAEAVSSTHVFADSDHDIALWFGGIDDLWKLGKPVGTGGPWMNTEVRAGVPSDPYLMLGYDRKSVRISHASDETVTVRLEIDIDGSGLWVPYRSFDVTRGSEVHHDFPPQFSAVWVRAISDSSTQATVQFRYE